MVNSDQMRNDSWLFSRRERQQEQVVQEQNAARPWKILIVDDEKQIHNVTSIALRRLVFENRPLAFISAFSAAEALVTLRQHQDIAVILLDVVMEEEDSGLKLARMIRRDLGNRMTRIILRTGQPGQAPEGQVIMEYDINDYKEKTELTAQKLFSTVVTALRSYRDLVAMETSKRALEKIIEASVTIFEIQSLRSFASGVLTQLIVLLDLWGEASDCETAGLLAVKTEEEEAFCIYAGNGDYQDRVGATLQDAIPADIYQLVRQAVQAKSSLFLPGQLCAFFQSKRGAESILYIDSPAPVNDWDRRLIDVYCANVAIAFENLLLNKEIEETQKEVIITLGEMAEARSRETGFHVKRVAECSALLAKAYGMPPEDVEVLRMASSMHDVGKLAIPDAILNKPGRLTPAEFEIMKTHCQIGNEMLKNSQRTVMKSAAMIALQHHEKFDGTGYPCGLKGNDIHIFSRITALSDVFDALGAVRSYKQPWPMQDILNYISQERGKHFDPHLIDIFMNCLDAIMAIRQRYQDP